MNIFWYGQSCFKIETTSQGKEKINLVIDPFSEKCGLKLPKMEADILLITNKEMTDKSKVSGDYFLIEGAGEYEVKNVFIKGIPSQTENIIYLLKLEEINICHLGFLQDNLKEEELEEIGKSRYFDGTYRRKPCSFAPESRRDFKPDRTLCLRYLWFFLCPN
jgi:hypothetical protein